MARGAVIALLLGVCLFLCIAVHAEVREATIDLDGEEGAAEGATEGGAPAEEEEESGFAVTLTDDNFEEIVLKDDVIAIVDFYAPWCGHCKNLEPEWEKVAEAFKDEPNIVVGKVDATKQTKLGNKYGIRSYPTIKTFFPGGKYGAEQGNYGKAQPFIDLLNAKAGIKRTIGGGFAPDAGRVKLLDKLVAALDDVEGDVQKLVDGVKRVAKEFESHASAKDAAGYVEAIEEYAAKGAGKLREVLDDINARLETEKDRAGRRALQLRRHLLANFAGTSGMNGKQLRAIAKERGINTAGVTEAADLRRAIRAANPSLDERIGSVDSVIEQVKALIAGDKKANDERLKRKEEQKQKEEERKERRRKEREEEAKSSVVKLRDYNFQKIVEDKEKTVLVEFYAPWCGHCKTLQPIWEEVAQTLADEGEKDIVIAKLDATADARSAGKYNVTGYPTIVMFSKTDKTGTKVYNGGRSKEAILEYVRADGGADEDASDEAENDAEPAAAAAEPEPEAEAEAEAEAATEGGEDEHDEL